MQWIHDYDLFLFDFDGLLVDTETLHHKAYQTMCSNRGFELSWSFERYAGFAHTDPYRIREEIYRDFPKLKASEPHWDILYKEKTEAYFGFLRMGNVNLMPGAEQMIRELEKRHKIMCVVTNSLWEMVEPIIDHHSVLEAIQHWVTREHYVQPKPDPECYQVAIERYASPGAHVIGFEDSPRGISALLGTNAVSVLITAIDYKETPALKEKGARHFHSFEDFMSRGP